MSAAKDEVKADLLNHLSKRLTDFKGQEQQLKLKLELFNNTQQDLTDVQNTIAALQAQITSLGG